MITGFEYDLLGGEGNPTQSYGSLAITLYNNDAAGNLIIQINPIFTPTRVSPG